MTPRISMAALRGGLAALESIVDRAESAEEPLELVAWAGRRLFGAAGVGLLLRDADGELVSVLATDAAGRELETAQAATGEGPCVEAVVLDRVVRTHDLREDSRWPRLAARLRSSEVRAVLGVNDPGGFHPGRARADLGDRLVDRVGGGVGALGLNLQAGAVEDPREVRRRAVAVDDLVLDLGAHHERQVARDERLQPADVCRVVAGDQLGQGRDRLHSLGHLLQRDDAGRLRAGARDGRSEVGARGLHHVRVAIRAAEHDRRDEVEYRVGAAEDDRSGASTGGRSMEPPGSRDLVPSLRSRSMFAHGLGAVLTWPRTPVWPGAGKIGGRPAGQPARARRWHWPRRRAPCRSWRSCRRRSS